MYIYVYVYIYIKLTCHKAHTRHKPPHYPFGCFFTHACQDMTYVRKHQLRSKLLWITSKQTGANKLFLNLQVEIILLTWPRSPPFPLAPCMVGKGQSPAWPSAFLKVLNQFIISPFKIQVVGTPRPKEIPFQTIIDGIWLKSLGCRCRLSRIQELCSVKMKDANEICLQQLSRKGSFKQATLAWNAICPLWLGIFHSIFSSQLLNSKKTTKKSPKTSNFPQVDCSTLIVKPIICVFFLRKNRTTLANWPTGQSPHPHWALRTSSLSSSMVGYPSPRHPDGSGRWVFGWKMFFAAENGLCKNGWIYR